VREGKVSRDFGQQERVHGEQQVGDHGEHRHVDPQIGARPKPAEDQQRGEAVAAMVDEIAEARPLDLAVARDRPVERIAEPVDEIARDRERQPRRVQIAERVARADRHRRQEREQGQLVGRDPRRKARADPHEQPLLALGQHIALDAPRAL
jgi:hypothetical protein